MENCSQKADQNTTSLSEGSKNSQCDKQQDQVQQNKKSAAKHSQSQKKPPTDKQLLNCFQHIEKIIQSLEIGQNVLEASKRIMKQVVESKRCKGKSAETLASAVVFIACREMQQSRTIKEIVSITQAREKDVFKAFQIIKNLENVNLSASNESAGEYAERICAKLGIQHISSWAKKVADFANQKDLAGKTPQTIASVAVYFICQISNDLKDKITMQQIQKVFNMGESTIKAAYRELWNVRNKIPGYSQG